MFLPRLFTGVAVVSLASAVRVTPGSPCASKCGNTLDATTGNDMACSKSDYTAVAGIVLDECLSCQRTSGYVNGDESDMKWFLYNIRYNLAYCVFGQMGSIYGTNPCRTSTACDPLLAAIEWNNFTTSGGPYDYCTEWERDEPFVPKCLACLTPLNNEPGFNYLSVPNFLTILEAACIQQPKLGDTLSFDGDPFSTTPIVITTPSPTYASVPMEDYGPVSLGARVGIAFGGIAFILSIVGFCIVWNGKRRRRAFLRDLERRHAEQGWPHPKTRYGGSSGGDMFETPVSQRPLRGWDESPVSAGPDPTLDRPLPRYFSPYSSQYNSPVSATDATSSAACHQWPTIPNQRLEQLIQEQSPAHGSPPPAFTQWPSPAQEKLMIQMHHERRQTEIAIGLALGGDDASLRSKNSNPNLGQYESNGYPLDKKGKERDEVYEMVESPYNNSGGSNGGGNPADGRYQMPAEPQAPVLHHPGYGRHHVSRPGTGGTNNSGGRTYLTDEDMRRGNLL